MFFSEVLSHLLNLCKASLHLAPSIPQCIIRICMECPLKCPHPMFKKHDKKFLLNHCWSIMECKQIRI